MEGHYTFDDFCGIVAKLRSEEGCPWDRAQTHDSLKPCMIHELTEAVAAVNLFERTGNARNLCEELGDLLLQVVLQSQIAMEEGLFTMEDVVQAVSEKMLRRHPHVFETGFRDENGELVRRWDEIKVLEKSGIPPEELEMQKQEEEKAALEVAEFLLKERREKGFESQINIV
ncbi:MAG: MazG nucleotide pyrophosphohydrolase domain-containing protein [Lachnospiraceae bacterium]|jgi:MazG family protein|nr:MazG nucleotide pyrophosphohydrolase domain-containing protein [Lachnospiraceae bacterium]